jgi:hypothetical protein
MTFSTEKSLYRRTRSSPPRIRDSENINLPSEMTVIGVVGADDVDVDVDDDAAADAAAAAAAAAVAAAPDAIAEPTHWMPAKCWPLA